MTTRLVQIQKGDLRKIGLVEEPRIRLLDNFSTIYDLVLSAIKERAGLQHLVRQLVSNESLDYDPIYRGQSEWRLLPVIDHPMDAARCLVSGTGLTHTASAKNRDAMHAHSDDLTDSMKMFYWGVEGGKPESGKIGAAPEWFYKGSGAVLKAHGEPLVIPAHAEDGGEEPEIAGVYVIGENGTPYRLGLTQGNEFSDHQFERRNYLYLAGSKLHNCAVGPELVLDHEFKSVPGRVSIERDGAVVWSHEIKSGEVEMCHSLGNIEHHHFKHQAHRRPGDVHLHFYGADAFSFGAGLKLSDRDVMKVSFQDFGRELANPVRIDSSKNNPVAVVPLS